MWYAAQFSRRKVFSIFDLHVWCGMKQELGIKSSVIHKTKYYRNYGKHDIEGDPSAWYYFVKQCTEPIALVSGIFQKYKMIWLGIWMEMNNVHWKDELNILANL